MLDDTPSLTVGLLPRTLDDRDLFGCQVIEFIDQIVDLPVERGALVFVESLVTLSARGGELLPGLEHLIEE